MEISHRATQALITGAIGIVAVFAVRFSLDFAYNRYERRLKQRDPMAVARRRTTFNFSRRVIVALVATVGDLGRPLALRRDLGDRRRRCSPRVPCSRSSPGLAFSTPLSNLGSGLLVAFTQPLRLGDRISVAGETGFVEEMDLIYTTLVTDDARRIFVPNTQLTTNTIVNRTIKDPAPARFRAASPSRSRRRSTRHAWYSSTRSPRCRARRRGRAGQGRRDRRSHRLARGCDVRADRRRRRRARERTPRARPPRSARRAASSQAERKRRVASRRNGRPQGACPCREDTLLRPARERSPGRQPSAGAGAASGAASRGRYSTV